MTKQLKKGLIAVLMVVFVAFSCVATLGAVNTARADETADRKAAFESSMAYFVDYNNTNAGITDAILAVEHHDEYRAMKLAYDALVKNGENVDYDNAVAGLGYISKQVRNVYADAQNVLDVMGGRIIDIYDLISTNELYYYYKAEVDAAYSKFSALGANEQAFVNTYTNNLYFYNELTTELNEINGRITDAIAAINAIDYYNGTAFADAATDFTALVAQEIVLSSIDSIGDAFDAVKLIYNKTYEELPAKEIEYSTNLVEAYGYLTSAKGAYEDIVDEAQVQEDALQAVIDHCVTNNVYYTYKDEIEAARTVYNTYITDSTRDNGGVNVNDVATLIENFEIDGTDNDQEFKDLEARVNTMQNAINGVVAKIAAIYAEYSNEIKYVESLEEIEAAEGAFNGLDLDIRTADEASTTTYFVTGEVASVVYDYADLVSARAAYDLLDAEIYGSEELNIEGLKPMTERLIGICEEGDATTTFENLYAEIEAIYTHGLTIEQKQVVDAMTFAYDNNKDGVDENYGMFALLTKIMQYTNSLKSNSTDLNEKIADLYAIYTADNSVVYTDGTFVTELLEVYVEFYGWVGNTVAHEEKIGTAFEGTAKDVNIYPYVKAAEVQLLTMYKARLDAVAAAEDWADAVDAMDDVITTANWDQFAAAKVEYEELKVTNLALFNCLNVHFGTQYPKYTAAATTVADIESKIVAAVEAMKNIDLTKVDFNNFVPADITVFTTSVGTATTAYEALYNANGGKDNTDTYLEATVDFTKESVIYNCQEAFENYETALTYVGSLAVETLIINLYGANTDTSFIDITYANEIANIKTEYDKLDGDAQAKVRNYESTTIAETYKNAEDALAVITNAYDAWIKTVAAIVDAEVSSDLTKEELLEIIDDGLTAISAPNVSAVSAFATYEYYYFDIDNYTGIVNNYNAFFNGLTEPTVIAAIEEYLEEAKLALEAFKVLSDNTIIYLTDVINYYNGVSDLSSEANIRAIVDEVYSIINEEIHAKQKEALPDFDAYDKVTAVAPFEAMLEALNEDVIVNENVTTDAEVTLNLIKTTYALLSSEQKALVNAKYLATTTAVEAKIAEVKAANELLSLKATVETLAGLGADVDTLKTQVADIEALIGDLGANATIVDAIDAAKQAAIDAAKAYTDELANGAVADNAAAIAENLAAIEELQGALEALEAAAATKVELAAKVTELEGKITAAKQAAIDAAEAYTDELANGAVATNATAIAANLAEINAIKALIGTLDAQDASVAAAIARLEGAIETAKQAAIDAAKAYTNGLITEVKGLITALKNTEVKANADAIAKEVADRAAEIARLEGVMATDTELADAIAAAKAEIKAVTDALDAAIKAEAAAREEAIKAEAAAREEAIKAEAAARAEADAAIKADLEAAVAQLNKTITIITVILGVVSLGMAGCLVFIFLKKRA